MLVKCACMRHQIIVPHIQNEFNTIREVANFYCVEQ